MGFKKKNFVSLMVGKRKIMSIFAFALGKLKFSREVSFVKILK